MEKSFKDKVVIVTGASSGIGKATAQAFAREGACVVLGDVLIEEGNSAASEINSQGQKATFVKCDVSVDSDIKNIVGTAVETYGGLDFAFNNAGTEGEQANTTDCTFENWDKVINTNLRGVWLCMKYEIPEMLKRGGGAIVNCSSIAGLVGFPMIPAYTASKHGVLGLTKTAALEFAKMNIRVNAVSPGAIKTPMIDRFTHGDAEAEKMLAAGEPVGRMGEPEEIAEAVLFLCSDKASFITGHPLAVDGGWVAQ